MEQAEKYYEADFPRPSIVLNLRGADAGQALPDRNMLRFNLAFFSRDPAHYLRQVVAHEVAHLVSFRIFGRNIRPHGKEWRQVMTKAFKLPATRCHSYDLSFTGRYPHIYQCGCPDKRINLSQIRHRRALKGVIYLCQHCGEKLQFTASVLPQP